MDTIKSIKINLKQKNNLILITAIAIILKTIQFIIISPQIVPDSNDYLFLSNHIFDFSSETFGLRTPVYPLFIKGLLANLNLIAAGQHLLGIISVILLYLSVREISTVKIAMIACLLLILSPIVLYDSVISTESLSVFFNILFLFTTIKALKSGRTLFTILSSAALIILIFTRPQYFIYIPAICLYFAIQRPVIRIYLIIIIPFLVSVLWVAAVYRTTGIFNMTTLSGFNLINHTGKYIEKAPAEYNFLKSVYIKQRDEDIRLRGSQSGTIWIVRDTIQKSLNLNKTQLSILLNKIDIYLILNFPLDYLRSVWSSLRLTFIVPDDDFRIIRNSFLFRFLLPFYQILIGIGFMGGIFTVCYLKKHSCHNIYILMFYLVIANVIASAIFDYGTNGRFFAPSYPMLFIWTAILIHDLKVLKPEGSKSPL